MPLTDQPTKGMYIEDEGRFFLVQDRKLKTQGRQGGLIIMKMKALDSGQVISKTIKAGVKVEQVFPETKEMQYLYSDQSGVFFMDTETYETISIPRDVVGGYVDFLKEGDKNLIMEYEGKILSLREKPAVELKVIESVDAVKGNTSNSATKLVTVETGYKVNVPLFIKTGDVIKINTEKREYTGKAN